jgi:hypothetical protein
MCARARGQGGPCCVGGGGVVVTMRRGGGEGDGTGGEKRRRKPKWWLPPRRLDDRRSSRFLSPVQCRLQKRNVEDEEKYFILSFSLFCSLFFELCLIICTE